MGLRSVLAGLAGQAPARVFPVVGSGARDSVDRLRSDPRLCFVDSPRAASLLLVAGDLPEPLRRPAQSVHDEIPHPRATVWWPLSGSGPVQSSFPGALVVREHEDVGGALARVQAALLDGRHAPDPDLLPDVDPAPWRGVGPYGQGGKGMTGGVPYGRPLAERAPDRDGLELDQLQVAIGPFFPPFPPGLVLDLKLQGDVIQAATVDGNAFAGSGRAAGMAPHALSPFVLALTRPVPIAELELARARHHLLWLGHALRVHGLYALGRRAYRLAWHIQPDHAGPVAAFGRCLERTRFLSWATAGVGVTDAASLAPVAPGPVSRAAGIAQDARLLDPAYAVLGFTPVIQHEGDARARWRQRLAEAVQALELAARVAGRSTTPVGRVEAPRGTLTPDASPAAGLLALLPQLLTGLEWGDAVTTLVSLDLDLEEAAHHPGAAA